jgi:gentisate 1,2-dioxygenase
MSTGDLVLTPNWTWHDHANDTAAPMIRLDGLDTPLVRMLEAGFYEQYDAEAQSVGARTDPSLAKYGAEGLRPVWEPAPATRYSPLWHYPLSQARAALERLVAEGVGSPGVILAYTNPATGGPAMPPSAGFVPAAGDDTYRTIFFFRQNFHRVLPVYKAASWAHT